jgi:hypothetical protein
MIQLPTKMPDFPPFCESVKRAVSAENLRAAASSTTEPLCLLGLSFLARSGDPVRSEIADRVASAAPEYGHIAALLPVAMDRIDADSVSELVQKDPENALGYYLQGALHHVSNREVEAMAAFRRASELPDMRFYSDTLGKALFVAVDTLKLEGQDRLCALSWTVSRWLGFSSVGIQPIYWALPELAKNADARFRSEVADFLFTLAGHLFATHFTNRWFAQRAVEQAFMIKAELEDEQSPRRGSYGTVLYGLAAPLFCVPGVKEWWNPGPLQLAQFVPDRICRAFADMDPETSGIGGEDKLALPEPDQAAFEAAKQNAAQAAKRLIEVALSDPEGILGAYLRAVPRPERGPGKGAAFEWTAVDNLLQKRPDLFQAAAAVEEKMAAVWKASENAPSRRNGERMLKIAGGLQSYANKHDQVCPESLDVLFETGDLKAPLEAKSVRTGRPYVYAAAREKIPENMNDRAQFVLFYDDEPIASGWLECAFAFCSVGAIRESDLKEHLRRRGKEA